MERADDSSGQHVCQPTAWRCLRPDDIDSSIGERFRAQVEAHPGCLAASFCYQDQLFNREIAKLNADGMLTWRKRFRERFDLIAKRYPPRNAVDFDALADMAATLVEGGLILGRVFKDVTILPRQILLYRDFVRSIFLPG